MAGTVDKSRGVKSSGIDSRGSKAGSQKPVRGGSQVDSSRSQGSSTKAKTPTSPLRDGSQMSGARKAKTQSMGVTKKPMTVRGNSIDKSRGTKVPNQSKKKTTR